jgi:hypothetical protein
MVGFKILIIYFILANLSARVFERINEMDSCKKVDCEYCQNKNFSIFWNCKINGKLYRQEEKNYSGMCCDYKEHNMASIWRALDRIVMGDIR